MWWVFFFFKQKTAYEIKECDWSSDVCSSDLSSEESAIRLVCPELDKVWIPTGGHPVIARLKGTEGHDVVEGGREIPGTVVMEV